MVRRYSSSKRRVSRRSRTRRSRTRRSRRTRRGGSNRLDQLYATAADLGTGFDGPTPAQVQFETDRIEGAAASKIQRQLRRRATKRASAAKKIKTAARSHVAKRSAAAKKIKTAARSHVAKRSAAAKKINTAILRHTAKREVLRKAALKKKHNRTPKQIKADKKAEKKASKKAASERLKDSAAASSPFAGVAMGSRGSQKAARGSQKAARGSQQAPPPHRSSLRRAAENTDVELQHIEDRLDTLSRGPRDPDQKRESTTLRQRKKVLLSKKY